MDVPLHCRRDYGVLTGIYTFYPVKKPPSSCLQITLLTDASVCPVRGLCLSAQRLVSVGLDTSVCQTPCKPPKRETLYLLIFNSLSRFPALPYFSMMNRM